MEYSCGSQTPIHLGVRAQDERHGKARANENKKSKARTPRQKDRKKVAHFGDPDPTSKERVPHRSEKCPRVLGGNDACSKRISLSE